MGDYWGIHAATDDLFLACVGLSLLLLIGLAVVSITVLRPKGDRLPWSLVAVEAGVILYGLAWYGVAGSH